MRLIAVMILATVVAGQVITDKTAHIVTCKNGTSAATDAPCKQFGSNFCCTEEKGTNDNLPFETYTCQDKTTFKT